MTNDNSQKPEVESGRLHTNAINKLNEISNEIPLLSYQALFILIGILFIIYPGSIGSIRESLFYTSKISIFALWGFTFLRVFKRASIIIIDLLSRIEYNTRK